MISYFYSFNPCIGINKMASTSPTIIYNSIESGQPQRTPDIKVEGLDRRTFTLILDWYTQLQSCE